MGRGWGWRVVVVQLGLRGDSQLRINCVTPVCNRCTARMKRHQGEGGRGGGCFWKAVRSNTVLVLIPCKATMEKQITTENKRYPFFSVFLFWMNMHCTLFIYFVARMMISRAHRSTQLRYERNRTKLSLRGDGARQTQPKSPVATGRQAQGETTLNHASDFPF